jgi:hypothetical protein
MTKDFTVTLEKHNKFIEITYNCEVTRTKQFDGSGRTWWQHELKEATPVSAIISDNNDSETVWDISQEYPRELLKVLTEFHDQLSESLNEQAAELVNSYEFKIGKERL